MRSLNDVVVVSSEPASGTSNTEARIDIRPLNDCNCRINVAAPTLIEGPEQVTVETRLNFDPTGG